MSSLRNNIDQQLDHNQYLIDYNNWTKELAEELARKNFIVENKLTEDHWKVIEFVRKFYADNCRGPSIVRISKTTGLSRKRICELFPCGTVRGAYRLAGLPRPPGCI